MGFKVTASYEDKKEEFINSFMKRFKDIVFATHARAKIYAPSNDGNLRSKITINDLGEGKYEIVSNVNYSAAMEYGTKPFTAPIAPLKEWAKKKFGNEEIGWAVWQKIRKEGITSHPYMTPARDYAKKELIKLFREIGN